MESGQAHEAPSFSIISSEENVDDRVSDNVEVPSLPTLNAGGLFEEKHPGLGSGCHWWDKPWFHTNAQLLKDHLLYEDMEETPTEKATQPIMEERRGEYQTMVNEMDKSDIICIFHPTSLAACRAVELVAKLTPQNILQNGGFSRNLNEPADQDSQAYSQHDSIDQLQPARTPSPKNPDEKPNEGSSQDIALRFSSPLHNPPMGFVFGRGAESDILLSDDQDDGLKVVSNRHFRVFLQPSGVLMLEDTSTNGTSVDKHILKRDPSTEIDTRRMIAGGEIIEVLLKGSVKCDIRFMVSIPRRDGDAEKLYLRNLHKYLLWLDQVKRGAQAFAQAAVDGQRPTIPPVHVPFKPFSDPIKGIGPTTDEDDLNPNLVNNQFNNHGMAWSGGERFNVIGLIGRGAFANVFQLATKRDGELYAAKQIDKRQFIKSNAADNKIHNEMHIMSKLCHPHIVQFLEHHDEPRYLYIIMEFVPGGDLSRFLKTSAAMPEYMCQSVAHQICDAVDYLHQCKVTHRDIKPDNILIQTRDPLVVKLSDFGLSKWISNEETFLKSFCGTLLYCAPEIYPDYEEERRGTQSKRRRSKKASPKPSPYKPSVDTWALGAVLYHLLCGTPPYHGGSADQNGRSMLRLILKLPLDCGRLKSAGVSSDGIDFVSHMIVVDADRRWTEAALLKHPWIAGMSRSEAHDIPMKGGPDTLTLVHEEDDQLDASGLGLAENLAHAKVDDSEEGLHTDVEDLAGDRESKRLKLHDSDDGFARQEDVSADGISYPQLPCAPSDSVYSEPVAPPSAPAGRLFGEIGASALRSSGVLGYDAHAALQMPLAGSRGDSFDTSASWVNDAGIVGDQEAPFARQYQPGSSGSASTRGAAPSLLGTEALVDRLNMASLSATSSGNTLEISPIRQGGDNSRAPTAPLPGSNNSFKQSESSRGASNDSSLLANQTVATANQPDDRSESRASCDEVTGPNRSLPPPGSLVGSHNIKLELGESARPRSPPQATTMAKAEEKTTVNRNENQPDVVDPAREANMAAHENTLRSRCASRIERSAAAATESGPSAGLAPQSFPKPPPRFGTLTPLPGSRYNQIIRLEGRATSYGRDPQSQVCHADRLEARIPKNALNIVFWRPGIEALIESGKDWSTLDDLYAIISTGTKRHIRVNGVKLSTGQGCWIYGRLHTGDIITIFGPLDDEKMNEGGGGGHGGDRNGTRNKGKGNAAEFLKYRCEFSLGLSAKPRPESQQPRFVVEREEEKYLQYQQRRSMSAATNTS